MDVIAIANACRCMRVLVSGMNYKFWKSGLLVGALVLLGMDDVDPRYLRAIVSFDKR